MTASWRWRFGPCCRFASRLRFGAQPGLQLGVVCDVLLAPLYCGGATRLLLHDLGSSARLRCQTLELVAATRYRRISRIRVAVRALMLVRELPRLLRGVACILDCGWREIVGHCKAAQGCTFSQASTADAQPRDQPQRAYGRSARWRCDLPAMRRDLADPRRLRVAPSSSRTRPTRSSGRWTRRFLLPRVRVDEVDQASASV
jgi:hypothetical protein